MKEFKADKLTVKTMASRTEMGQVAAPSQNEVLKRSAVLYLDADSSSLL